jgi:hypothetical protein
VRRADSLTNFMCRLSRNLGASASWNPQGLSRPVMGLRYLYCTELLYIVNNSEVIFIDCLTTMILFYVKYISEDNIID